jgi:hypothetical protein
MKARSTKLAKASTHCNVRHSNTRQGTVRGKVAKMGRWLATAALVSQTSLAPVPGYAAGWGTPQFPQPPSFSLPTIPSPEDLYAFRPWAGVACAAQTPAAPCVIKIGALSFKTQWGNLNGLENGTGFTASGQLTIVTPESIPDIPLLQANLIFEEGDSPLGGIAKLRGTAEIPFPQLEDANLGGFNKTVMAEVGLDYGSNLEHLNAHLNADRQYVFFRATSGAEVSLAFNPIPNTTTPLSFSADIGATFVLDPLDPYFYLAGASPLGSLASLEEGGGHTTYGFGFSVQGKIPFAPQQKFGLPEEVAKNFTGNLVVDGTFTIPETPLFVEGSMVAGLDIEGYGYRIGANGTLYAGLPFEGIDFSIVLGNATVMVSETQDDHLAYLSGEIDPDDSFLPDWIPFRQQQKAQVYGMLSSRNIANSFLHAEGEFSWDTTGFKNLTGVDLGDLITEHGSLDIRKEGVTLKGSLGNGISLPGYSTHNAVEIEAFVGILDYQASYMQTRGEFSTAANFGLGVNPTAKALAEQRLDEARAELTRLLTLLQAMRNTVQNERNAIMQQLQEAQNVVHTAQLEVNRLATDIHGQNWWINTRKAEIANWNSWYDGLSWGQKINPANITKLAYEVGWRGIEIADRYLTIADLERQKETAQAALQTAQAALQLVQNQVVTTPIDADPRVAALMASYTAAQAARAAAWQALHNLPTVEINGTVSGDIRVRVGVSGMTGVVNGQACWNNQCVALPQDTGVNFNTQPPSFQVTLPGLGEKTFTL